MTISDWLIICATIVGPVLAVQAQKWVEGYREVRAQKVTVFSTLMITRATKLAVDHVKALNTIDIVFRNDKSVTDVWREYYELLSTENPTSRRNDKFVDLMFAMSSSLKFGFDKVMLQRVIYLPQGHVNAEVIQAEIQQNLNLMLSGQRVIQEGVKQILSGEKALRVAIEGGITPSGGTYAGPKVVK
ncbi:DUF6680 family protein [Acidisoma sp. S159]|uniref:DUF6680 family protein n=1 Tax=Acidisoma sp. S159 TaxID=1747225 RepID=UPI00131D461B|nr:DUF6680 family protein [Acidisoma sp. S159]